MVSSGKLVRVGSSVIFCRNKRFSPHGTGKLILDYLQKGAPLSPGFCAASNILPRQVYPILRHLVLSGDIVLRDGRYYLSRPQD
jgi:hypothetical protein